MPLYRTASLQLAAGAVAAPAGNPGGAPTTVASIAPASAAQQQFLAQRGTVEHRAAATPTRSAPVPLQLSGGMGAIPGASPGVTRAGEADFARRMMEALDKYRDMQGAHGVAAAGPAPGSLVNLSQ
jgi:hypothetical protein